MVEEIVCPSQKIIGIERPALDGNGDAELMLFVALPTQRNEIKLLLRLDIG